MSQLAMPVALARCHVAVVGSRSWNNHKRVFSILDSVKKRVGELIIVSGACPSGPDFWAERWARKHGIEMRLFPANWSQGAAPAWPAIRRSLIAQTALSPSGMDRAAARSIR